MIIVFQTFYIVQNISGTTYYMQKFECRSPYKIKENDLRRLYTYIDVLTDMTN